MKNIRLAELAQLKVGSPQFRIKESQSETSLIYKVYNQSDLEEDLTGRVSQQTESKQICTSDPVSTLKRGDLVFSLISGTAAIVTKEHEGYLYTQNYIVLESSDRVDKRFLLYLLNEDKSVKRQFLLGLQGSTILKYTVKQIRDLILPFEVSLERQRIIGEIYQKQVHLEARKKAQAERSSQLIMRKLEEVRKA